MNDYSQPDFYRFNSDSLKLVHFILAQKINPKSILDLGAGCGIIGIELAQLLKPVNLTLVELQEEFRSHLELNVNHFLNMNTATEIIISAFSQWTSKRLYDLIVANPPYYLPGKGQPSKGHQRGLTRTFSQDSWRVMLEKIQQCLSSSGKAFIVIKKDPALRLEIEKCCSRLKLKNDFQEDDQLWIVEVNHLD